MRSTFWMTVQEAEDEIKSREIKTDDRIKLVCLECGKTKKVSCNAKTEPRFSCGSVDLEVR
jgi:hypothetical protein